MFLGRIEVSRETGGGGADSDNKGMGRNGTCVRVRHTGFAVHMRVWGFFMTGYEHELVKTWRLGAYDFMPFGWVSRRSYEAITRVVNLEEGIGIHQLMHSAAN